MHKSSVHTAFGSKADLQVAVLRRTREILIEHVIAPSLTAAPGRPRLLAVGEAWFAYLAGGVFEGGCVLSSASSRARRPARARARRARRRDDRVARRSSPATPARRSRPGDIAAGADPDQIAFELQAIGMTANWHHQLFGGDAAFRAARVAWADVLERHAPRA